MNYSKGVNEIEFEIPSLVFTYVHIMSTDISIYVVLGGGLLYLPCVSHQNNVASMIDLITASSSDKLSNGSL